MAGTDYQAQVSYIYGNTVAQAKLRVYYIDAISALCDAHAVLTPDYEALDHKTTLVDLLRVIWTGYHAIQSKGTVRA